MDGAIKSKRMFPAYTTAQLEQFVADIKANDAGSDACMRMIAMQDEIDRRKTGSASVTTIPQITPLARFSDPAYLKAERAVTRKQKAIRRAVK